MSLISYAGELTVGIMVDSRLVPDLARLRQLVDEELDEFRTAAADAGLSQT